MPFFLLTYAFMSQLVFECAVGVFVLVRCFVDRKATENAIVDRLGDGFSRPPFATVVVLYYTFCTYLLAEHYFAAKIQLFVVFISRSGSMYSRFVTCNRSVGRTILFSHHSYS